MKTYTVKEISKLLNTNEETVRRWIRSGKLGATSHSKKGGNIITVNEFNKFLQSTPKYGAMIATIATSTIPIAAIMGTVIGSIVGTKRVSKQKKLTAVDIEGILNEKLRTHQENLEKKKKALIQLQNEIVAEEQNIKKYQTALSTLDLNAIAEEVNMSAQQIISDEKKGEY